jgi:mannose-6-phosphate isomerase-like protein (cupin superfamily)
MGPEPAVPEQSSGHATVAAAAATPLSDDISVHVFKHGSMELEYYAPRGSDPQRPHQRDELYVIISGRGMFRNGEKRHEFGPGDVLFVPTGVEHRFEEFSDDFATWVIFWGPKGGEAAVGEVED